MYSFFCSEFPDSLSGDTILLEEKGSSAFLQHCKVRRIRSGEKIKIFNGAGKIYECMVEEYLKKSITLKVTNAQTSNIIKNLHLWIPPLEVTPVETILDMCTQVGVTDFHFFTSKQSQEGHYLNSQSKRDRFERIIKEAAAQSEQAYLPRIHWELVALASLPLPEYVQDRHIVPIERAQYSTSQILDTKTTHIYIGPEGGWTQKEVETLSTSPFIPVSFSTMGVLRAETAAIIASGLASEGCL